MIAAYKLQWSAKKVGGGEGVEGGWEGGREGEREEGQWEEGASFKN